MSNSDPLLPVERGRLQETAGEQAAARGEWAEAERCYAAAIDAYSRCQRDAYGRGAPGEATCLAGLAEAALQRSDTSAARDALRRAWQVTHTGAPDEQGPGGWDRSGYYSAHLYDSPDDRTPAAYRRACDGAIKEAQATAPASADTYAGACIALHAEKAGDQAADAGERAAAERFFERASKAYAQCASPREAVCLQRLGSFALDRDDAATAQRLAGEALHLLDKHSSGIQVDGIKAASARLLADAQAASAVYDRAAKSYQLAVELYQSVGDRFNGGRCLGAMGELARRHGDTALARELFEHALAAFETAEGASPGEVARARGGVQLGLARVELGQGATATAWRHAEEALQDLRAGDDGGTHSWALAAEGGCLQVQATVAAMRGDEARAGGYLREAAQRYGAAAGGDLEVAGRLATEGLQLLAHVTARADRAPRSDAPVSVRDTPATSVRPKLRPARRPSIR